MLNGSLLRTIPGRRLRCATLDRQPLRAYLGRGLVACAVLSLAACGGGGGSGTDTPKTPEGIQLLMRRGDEMPGGLVVNSVESARMANDGTVVAIASQAGTPAINGVYRRRPSGQFDLVLDQGSPLAAGLAMTDVAQLLVSTTGEAVFKEGGNRIKAETVFYYDGGQTLRLAGAAAPTTPTGFEKLGELRLGPDGRVAFTYGNACDVDSSSGTDRFTCDLTLLTGTPDNLVQVGLPNALTRQRPTAVGLEYNTAGDLLVGLPASGRNPLIGIVRNGLFDSIVERQAVLPGYGKLVSATARSIATNGDVIFDAGFDTDDNGERDQERLLLYSGGGFQSIAQLGEPAGSKFVVDVRGLAVDDRGQVTFQVNFNDRDQSTGPISLRQWANGVTREIAYEGMGTFGEDDMGHSYKLLEIESIRANHVGDVAFTARVGFVDNGTQNTEETRLLVDRGAGLETVLRTGVKFSAGTISGIETLADINDSGDLLVIVELRGQGRALVLLPRV
jgi:hypothetical protein